MAKTTTRHPNDPVLVTKLFQFPPTERCTFFSFIKVVSLSTSICVKNFNDGKLVLRFLELG